jgi:hypothetical protein
MNNPHGACTKVNNIQLLVGRSPTASAITHDACRGQPHRCLRLRHAQPTCSRVYRVFVCLKKRMITRERDGEEGAGRKEGRGEEVGEEEI